jgi:hypothetical protein
MVQYIFSSAALLPHTYIHTVYNSLNHVSTAVRLRSVLSPAADSHAAVAPRAKKYRPVTTSPNIHRALLQGPPKLAAPISSSRPITLPAASHYRIAPPQIAPRKSPPQSLVWALGRIVRSSRRSGNCLPLLSGWSGDRSIAPPASSCPHGPRRVTRLPRSPPRWVARISSAPPILPLILLLLFLFHSSSPSPSPASSPAGPDVLPELNLPPPPPPPPPHRSTTTTPLLCDLPGAPPALRRHVVLLHHRDQLLRLRLPLHLDPRGHPGRGLLPRLPVPEEQDEARLPPAHLPPLRARAVEVQGPARREVQLALVLQESLRRPGAQSPIARWLSLPALPEDAHRHLLRRLLHHLARPVPRQCHRRWGPDPV